MSPLRYAGHDGEPHFHRKHIAIVCMSLGFVAGLISGVCIRSVTDVLPAEKRWTAPKITCRASIHDDGQHVYFLENSGPDFLIKSPTDVYGVDSRGLIPNAGKLLPVAIPRGTTVAAVVIGTSKEYVLLDVANRRRLEFR